MAACRYQKLDSAKSNDPRGGPDASGLASELIEFLVITVFSFVPIRKLQNSGRSRGRPDFLHSHPSHSLTERVSTDRIAIMPPIARNTAPRERLGLLSGRSIPQWDLL
jgi:hypothetical protein